MENPKQGSHAIAKLTGTCRNFVDKVIHIYNVYGLQDVLFTEEKEGRPNRLGGQWHAVSEALVKGVPRSAKEAVNIIRAISGHTFSLTWARVLMRDAGMDYRKLQSVPGKADPEKQKEWIADIQPVIAEAEEGRRRLLFMDAVHFTLEAFTCKVWCKGQLYLPTGAGRNRFNLLGAIDPFSLDLIQSHSMIHHHQGLKTLLTLKFQSFENAHLLCA